MSENQLLLSSGARKKLLAVLFVGVLIGALDIAIVGPAMPAIAAEFAVDSAQLSWVLSIFVLFNLISAPISARCSDRYGRRDVYICSIGLFALGSLTVAFSSQFEWLLVGRAIQAIGAGGLFPVASAAIADVFPVTERGRALGLIGAVFGIAFLLGPIVGGLLLPFGWPMLFLINIPICVVLPIAAMRVLPTRRSEQRVPFDFGGAILLCASLLALAWTIQSLSEGPGAFSARPLTLIGTGGFGFVCLLAFFWVEQRVADPLFPPAILASRPLRIIGLIAIVTGLVEAAMVFLPAVAVDGFGVSESRASFMLLPLVIGLLIGAPAAGRAVDRVGVRPVIQLGLVLLGAGLCVFAAFSLSIVQFYIAGSLIGFGLASLLGAPLRYAALAEVGPRNRGLSQGLLSLSLGAGQIIGAAVLGAFMAAALQSITGFRQAAWVVAFAVLIAIVASFGLRHPATEAVKQ